MQNIGHELSKIAINGPRFADNDDARKTDRFRVKQNGLLAEDSGNSESGGSEARSEVNAADGDGDEQCVIFGAQRRYDKPPGR